MAERLCGR